jgi:hypothetical protein
MSIGLRFIIDLFLTAWLFSVVARVTLAEDEWTTPIAVWGCALALAATDVWATKKKARK